MHFSTLALAFWADSLVINSAAVTVLFLRGRFRQFPFLASLFALYVVRTLVLFYAYMHQAKLLYRDTYYCFLVFDYLLQLAVILEISRIVLRPTGTWVRDARAMFAGIGLSGAVVAAAISFWISPPVHSGWQLWPLRANLFTSLLTCELFVAMSFTANRLGLGWRNHVMAVAQGLTFWNVVMVVTTCLQSYFGAAHFVGLDQIRGVSYAVGTIYIVVQLWRPEPERRPIDPELRRYILALHDRVEYDLRRMDA